MENYDEKQEKSVDEGENVESIIKGFQISPS